MPLTDATAGRTARRDPIDILARYSAPIFLVLLVIVFTALEPNFLHPLNLMNVLRQVSISGLIAIGMTFVILTAGIDLSVGSLVALTGLVAAYVAKGGLESRFAVGQAADAGNPVILAFLAAIAVGHRRRGAAGLGDHPAQGAALRRHARRAHRLPRRGAAALAAAGRSRASARPTPGGGRAGSRGCRCRSSSSSPPPSSRYVVLRHTRFGLHVYAVGGNAAAADLNGVSSRRVIFSVYVIVGFVCGLASFLLSARLNSAEAVAGLGLELDVIAAVVIGGTSLFGGVGGVFGTVVGALLIGVLRNGLVLLNVSPFIQQILIGLILVAAVAFDQYAAARRRA